MTGLLQDVAQFAGAAWLSVAQMRKRWAYEQEFAQYDDPL